MAYTPNTTRRIDPDHYETSPSSDYLTVAEVMGCPNAHTHEPDRVDMDRIAALTRKDRSTEYRKKHALEVSS